MRKNKKYEQVTKRIASIPHTLWVGWHLLDATRPIYSSIVKVTLLNQLFNIRDIVDIDLAVVV